MFDEIINALPPEGIVFPTLGGRSEFSARPSADGNHLIITSGGGTGYTINENMLIQIYDRYFDLAEDQRIMAGQYVQPNWQECPGNQQSPYVAALIHYRRRGDF